MLGDIEVEDAPPVVGEHDEDEQDAQARGGNREEIDGDEVPDVIGQERAPRLRRRRAALREQAGDGALSDVDSQLLQFAMDSRRAPERIGLSHSYDESPDLAACAWAARRRASRESGPVLAEAAALPPQDAVR